MTYQFILDNQDASIKELRELIEKEDPNGKLDSLKEILKFLSNASDEQKLEDFVSDSIDDETAEDEDIVNLFKQQ